MNKVNVIKNETKFYNNFDLLIPNLNTSLLYRVSVLCFVFLGKKKMRVSSLLCSLLFVFKIYINII
jgi:hypothetical protein